MRVLMTIVIIGTISLPSTQTSQPFIPMGLIPHSEAALRDLLSIRNLSGTDCFTPSTSSVRRRHAPT
jgi:hypothetical protein